MFAHKFILDPIFFGHKSYFFSHKEYFWTQNTFEHKIFLTQICLIPIFIADFLTQNLFNPQYFRDSKTIFIQIFYKNSVAQNFFWYPKSRSFLGGLKIKSAPKFILDPIFSDTQILFFFGHKENFWTQNTFDHKIFLTTFFLSKFFDDKYFDTKSIYARIFLGPKSNFDPNIFTRILLPKTFFGTQILEELKSLAL